MAMLLFLALASQKFILWCGLFDLAYACVKLSYTCPWSFALLTFRIRCISEFGITNHAVNSDAELILNSRDWKGESNLGLETDWISVGGRAQQSLYFNQVICEWPTQPFSKRENYCLGDESQESASLLVRFSSSLENKSEAYQSGLNQENLVG